MIGTLLIFLSFAVPFSPIFLVRWSRWLAIMQQKEYRIDRLWSFMNSAEGQMDIWRVIPSLSEFSRTGLKRPVRTLRVLIVGIISIVIMGSVLWGVWLIGNGYALIGTLLLLYVLIPFLLLLSCLPTAILSFLFTYLTLWRAQHALQQAKPLIIGLGGSYGKTSTKHLLHHVLSQQFSVFVTPKSHNTKYSVAKSILDGYAGQQIALLEYGAYVRGEIAYMTQWFPPKIAIETGFTLQHLGLFGSEENSMLAESELVAALPSDGQVFCHAADPGALKICQLGAAHNQLKIIPYSGEQTVVQLKKASLNIRGELAFEWNGQSIQTKLIGKHYLPNVQGVIAVAQSLGMSSEAIAAALTSFVPNTSFIQSFVLQRGTTVIDDGGTSNPKGFAAAIELAKEVKQKRKILVASGIVDLGEQAGQVHRDLALQAKDAFDEVWYVGQEGQGEFCDTFGVQCITQQEKVLSMLAQADATTLIVIEGKMPKWFLEQLR